MAGSWKKTANVTGPAGRIVKVSAFDIPHGSPARVDVGGTPQDRLLSIGVPDGKEGPQGLPGANSLPTAEAFEGHVRLPGPARDALTEGFVRRTNDHEGKERWYFGPKTASAPFGLLHAEYHGGWLAQRFSIGGTWDAAVRTAPTIEVFPAVPAYRPDLPGYAEGVGANAIDPVTCIQAYRLGHGRITLTSIG